jgi:hypothetical protein
MLEGDRRDRILGRERGGTGRCDDHSDPSAGQVGRQRGSRSS